MSTSRLTGRSSGAVTHSSAPSCTPTPASTSWVRLRVMTVALPVTTDSSEKIRRPFPQRSSVPASLRGRSLSGGTRGPYRWHDSRGPRRPEDAKAG